MTRMRFPSRSAGMECEVSARWRARTPPGALVVALQSEAKAALESTARYLARDLGPDRVRVNLVAAGPVRTVAAKAIPGLSVFEGIWGERAPLGWDIADSSAVAKACVALMSDLFPATTGEIIHVDGGFHAVGA